MFKYAKLWPWFIIPFLVDRYTKYLVLIDWIRSTTICDFMNIYVTYNRGISWGIGSDLDDGHRLLLNLFIAGVLLYFIYSMRTMVHNIYLSIAGMLILAGGISNFIDRVWYGNVIDFLQFHINDWYFPVFNIADVSITVGAILMLYVIIFTPES